MTCFLEKKLKAVELQTKDAKKIEKMEKARNAKTKDIKKKAEILNSVIKEKQKFKRNLEKDIITQSLKNFREVIGVSKESELHTSVKKVQTNTPMENLKHEYERQTQFNQEMDLIYQEIMQFYNEYQEKTAEVVYRVESLKNLKKSKSKVRELKSKSPLKTDFADELANIYIQKIRKYDANKAIKEKKCLKEMHLKEKQFKELIKSKKQTAKEFQKAKFEEKMEEHIKNEKRTEKTIKNKENVLAQIVQRNHAVIEKVQQVIGRNSDLKEALVILSGLSKSIVFGWIR